MVAMQIFGGHHLYHNHTLGQGAKHMELSDHDLLHQTLTNGLDREKSGDREERDGGGGVMWRLVGWWWRSR